MGVGEETEGVSRAFLVLHHHSGISALCLGAVTSLVIQLNEPDISSCNSPSEGDSEGVVGTCLQCLKLGRSKFEQFSYQKVTRVSNLAYQDNGFQDTLHVNPSDLNTSSKTAQDAIMRGRLPSGLEEEMTRRLCAPPFHGVFVAVRCSGTDEDSAAHSFAGLRK